MDAYAKNQLGKSEQIQASATVAWSFFYVQWVFCIGLVVLSLFVQLLPAQAIMWAFAVWIGVSPVLNILGTEVAITNQRLIIKQGLIARQTLELGFQKIESTSIEQSIMGRLLGYGTLCISGVGSTKWRVEGIKNPEHITVVINGTLKQAESTANQNKND